MSYDKVQFSLMVVREDLEAFAERSNKRIQTLEAENAALKTRIKQMEKADEVLTAAAMGSDLIVSKVKEAIQEARAPSVWEKVSEIGKRIIDKIDCIIHTAERERNAASKQFPNGFTAEIKPCATTEKALQNVLFYNPGAPFNGPIYVRPDPFPEALVAGACAKLVYDPDTPVGGIESSMLHRLYFRLSVGQNAKFMPCPAPPVLESCILHVTRINNNYGVPIPQLAEPWIGPLDGTICMMGCAFALRIGNAQYKITPLQTTPSAGVFRATTSLTIMTENEVV